MDNDSTEGGVTMSTKSITLELLEEDWREVYRALESKQERIEGGHYGADNNDWVLQLGCIRRYLKGRFEEEGITY